MDSSNNVVRFPVINERLDLSNITIDQSLVADEIRIMKLTYFSKMAEEMVDDTLRSIESLNLDGRAKRETFPMDDKDLILMKEAVVSALCRIVGLDHPLHKFLESNLELTEETFEGPDIIQGYRFIDDPV